MCNAAAIGAIAGMGMQAYGTFKQMDAEKAAARQAEHNSAAARLAAEWAKEDASYEASRLQMRADQIVSHIRTTGAGQNVDLSKGTAARLPSDVRVVSEVDKNMVLLRGAQKAAGYILQGDTFSAQAAVSMDMANATMVSGMANLLYQGTSWWASQDASQGAPATQSAGTDYNNGHPDWGSVPESDYGAGD
jgi:hypothetical protein